MHQRVEKIDVNNSIRTAYLRDASGNIMAVYQYQNGVWTHQEQHLYGAERLGVHTKPVPIAATGHNYAYLAVKKYELTNHLGNVMAVVTDRRFVHASGTFATAEVVSATDYFPFGMEMTGRTFNSDAYSFGFNGKVEDSEILPNGRWQDYGFRAYRPDLGRWISIDPLVVKYPEFSPYSFTLNCPIVMLDYDGRDVTLSSSFKKTMILAFRIFRSTDMARALMNKYANHGSGDFKLAKNQKRNIYMSKHTLLFTDESQDWIEWLAGGTQTMLYYKEGNNWVKFQKGETKVKSGMIFKVQISIVSDEEDGYKAVVLNHEAFLWANQITNAIEKWEKGEIDNKGFEKLLNFSIKNGYATITDPYSELQKAHRELLLKLESQLGANPETDKVIKAQIAAAEQAMINEVDILHADWFCAWVKS